MGGTGLKKIEFTNADLRRLIIPLIIEQFLSIMVGLLDSMMVAQVGEAAVSAVSLVDSVNVLLVQAFAALGTGGAVIAGQYLGRRETGQARHAGSQLLLFMGELALLVTALLYVGRNFVLGVVFGQVEADVAAYARTYYLITEASTPFLAIYSAGAALFRVMGNSRVSMWVSLVMNGINVLGNALLIFGFRMAVEGVAIPTLVSRVAAAAMILVLLRKPELPLRLERFTLRHDLFVVKNILKFGVTNGMESSVFQLGKLLLVSTVSALGTAAVAAHAIGHTLVYVQNIPGNAIGLAMVTVVSQCVGAGDYDKVRYYIKKIMKLSYLGTWIAIALVLIFLTPIMQIYHVSPEADYYARMIAWLHGLVGILVWPLGFVLPQALRAAGDTRFTMLVSVLSMWTVRVGLGIVLVRFCGAGVMGIWYAMLVDWAVRIAFFMPRVLGHKWETKGIKE